MMIPLMAALTVNFLIALFIALDAAKYRPVRKSRIRPDMSMLAKRTRGNMKWRYS